MVIVIVTVAILSIVAVPIYRRHIENSMLTEAKTLMSTIERGEAVWYVAHTRYLDIDSGTSFNSDLDIDVRSNKYFNSFGVTTGNDGSSATAITKGIGAASSVSLTSIFSNGGRPVRYENFT